MERNREPHFAGVFMKAKFVLLVLCLGLIGSISLSTDVVHAQDSPKTIQVVARRFAFEPSEITVHKGQPVVLVLKSEDVAHGLRFRDLDLNVKVDKGSTAELRFTPDKTGDFIGHCSIFCGSGHGGMTLTLHVVD
jgi:cytochrome c oxidase subunit 2